MEYPPNSGINRRTALKGLAATAGAATFCTAGAAAQETSLYRAKNGKIRQSVVPWCFKPMSVVELAKHSATLGLQSVELCSPNDWPKLKELGLTCAIAGSHGFAKGFAHPEEQPECVEKLRASIDASAAFGCPNVITFSGFARGLTKEQGLRNMVEGFKKIVGYAEEKKITLCLEMLNSRVNVEMKGHPDYLADDIDYAVEVCKQVGSERMKVLFDIYHVQIMNGDVITRIKQHAPYIGHVHTAGNPGRAEIDDTQEINYAPIMRTLVEVGYQGFVGQEFIPKREPIASLSQAVQICDV
ncbi:MAG: hydroxypyruvate isomerase [Verrucomicrobiaceae bacterium]|nr:MAG: hydroxypyruvate isomerase [Verrucomicrobiaceae bacterium]